MYKYSARLALFSFIICLLFLFTAFKGNFNWYTGFVFSLWLTLALFNYRHCTTLWRLKNKRSHFISLFIFVFLIGISGDYFIGQRITLAWIYPHYHHILDWIKLYLIIYPFGGLSVLELIIFIGVVFKERLILIQRPKSPFHFSLDIANYILDLIMIGGLILFPLLFLVHTILPFQSTIIVSSLILWLLTSTVQAIYHLRNGMHWLWIFLLSVFLFIVLHEIPNTVALEWHYLSTTALEETLPVLNDLIVGVPYWVILGWYMILIMMYKLWTHVHSISFREEKELPRRKISKKRTK